MDNVDILLIADPRFSGGTSTALITDVEAFLGLGAKVGLLFVRSGFFAKTDDPNNPSVLELRDRAGVTVIDPEATAQAATVFLHHPLPFYHGVETRARIKAQKSVLVVHHPPFRGNGSMEYNPVLTQRAIRQQFGLSPLWAPVSGAIRTQLRSFAPLIRMTNTNWVNAFDAADWLPARPAFDGGSQVVGRHGRPDMLKWPDRASDVKASLHLGDGWQVRVMGCPDGLMEQHGLDTAGWELLPFNAEPVGQFLNSLDVFSYYYSDLWFEAFGRTVTEAMLMERPCIVDPRLRDTFGPLAQYCQPSEVADAAARLRDNPKTTRQAAAAAREKMIERYSTDQIGVRLKKLAEDRGTISRAGPKSSAALQTLRKSIGLARRRRAGIEL